MNKLEDFKDVFAGVKPWAGQVPKGYTVDFLGTLTDANFRQAFTGDPTAISERHVQTRLPSLDESGEWWFETVNWVAAAREASDRFVMITLGAWHGSQAVGSQRALQQINPMPYKLVAVEPVPENVALVRRHFQNNGIDPDAHWIVPMAVSGCTDPVLFAIVPQRFGPQNCVSTNEGLARERYYRDLVGTGKTKQALSDLLLRNSTGITVAGEGGGLLQGEIRYVSAITLNELLGPFDKVDYLESDIQESEKLVFPPFMDLLKRKVRRIHIGTHGKQTHWTLHDLFAREGWDIVFSYEPQTVHETVLGSFRTEDGVLTVRNAGL